MRSFVIPPVVSIVIPVFNEEAVLPELFKRLTAVFDGRPDVTWCALLVNDGSMNVLNGTRRMRAYAIFQALRYVLIILTLISLVLAGFSGAYLAWCFFVSELFIAVGLFKFIHQFVVRFGFRHVARSWVFRHGSHGRSSAG